MAQQQEDEAVLDLKEGYRRSAGARYFRAAVYRFSGERQIPPRPQKSASYQTARASFAKAIELMPLPHEHVEVNSPDGIQPGYFIQAATERPAPVVIFYSGFDVVKEMLYCFIHEEFAHRGISCRVIDTPVVGEPCRFVTSHRDPITNFPHEPALLAQIETWRLEHGRPPGEPRSVEVECESSWPTVAGLTFSATASESLLRLTTDCRSANSLPRLPSNASIQAASPSLPASKQKYAAEPQLARARESMEGMT